MVADIFEQSGGSENWENLDPMLLYNLITTKNQEQVPKDLATTENVTFNANQNAHGQEVLFNISGMSCGCM